MKHFRYTSSIVYLFLYELQQVLLILMTNLQWFSRVFTYSRTYYMLVRLYTSVYTHFSVHCIYTYICTYYV